MAEGYEEAKSNFTYVNMLIIIIRHNYMNETFRTCQMYTSG